MEKISLRKQVKNMEVGQSFTIPMAQVGYTTLRSYASELGLQFERKYATRADRANRTFTISRIY